MQSAGDQTRQAARNDMVDLHCHLLPSIDDGPKSMAEALEMARCAWAGGIRKAVLTPHLHIGRYENDLASIAAATRVFAAELQRQDIALEIAFAAEIRICPELTALVATEIAPFVGELGGMKIVLLEFPHSHIPVGSDKMVDWLLAHNVRPMIAHPERNKDVMRKIDKIRPFVEMGCLMQVTAGSVAGRFGPVAQQRARDLLERGFVHVLASDAHNLSVRRPELEEGRAAAQGIVGEAASWALVRETPLAITAGRFDKVSADA
jgi:protein-tyrosine phosphatase